MKIAPDTVVRFHYRVGEPGQAASESSFESEPVAALIGHGNIVPGLEDALLGREAGERFEVTLTPRQAYGERIEGRIQRLPRKHFGNRRVRAGERVMLDTRFGPRPATVTKVGVSVVDVDLNHPMAGRSLHFEVEVLEVRAATAEEIAHRHVHGPGGHEHGP